MSGGGGGRGDRYIPWVGMGETNYTITPPPSRDLSPDTDTNLGKLGEEKGGCSVSVAINNR